MGRSHAVRLAEEGADVIALDICALVEGVVYPHATKEDLTETVRQVKNHGRRVETVIVNTRDLGTMKIAVDRAVTRLSGLVVVANAGIMMVGAWDEVSPQQWRTVIDVNLTGT